MSAEWGFYGRSEELGALLERMRSRRWFFGTIRGRRRIGKTALIQQAIEILRADVPDAGPWLVVEIPDSSPADFAAVFRAGLRETGLDSLAGARAVAGLAGVAEAVGRLCEAGVTVVLDEFQVCRRGPLSGFPSLVKMQVDRLEGRAAVGGLILLGSVQTEMEALLENRQAPLYGRSTFGITLEPWGPSDVLEVAACHGAEDPARTLTLWTLLGGVPKYWRDVAATRGLDGIERWEEWAQEACRRLFLRGDSPLAEEGRSLLGSELRRGNLAVLRAVARHGPSTHADLKGALPDLSLGPYLHNLTYDLRLVERQQPVFARSGQRRARYVVSDPFLLAWLRVIQPARGAARVQPTARVVEGLLSRLETLEGLAFERLVRSACEEMSRMGRGFAVTDRVRGYWNRPQSSKASVELDLVVWNSETCAVRFGSCKRRDARHDRKSRSRFREHVEIFLESTGRRFAGWRRDYVLYSPRFAPGRRARLEADGWKCRDLSDFRRALRAPGRGSRGPSPMSPKIAGGG